MPRFALTIFLSAFLLFQVQPLVARYILPWFGGSPAVWTTCLLFFQMLLLLGYLYAHLVSTKLAVHKQALLHALLLLGSLAVLPIVPNAAWKPAGDENPAVRILLLLLMTVGGPYFLLSTTGPLVQRWFSLLKPEGATYRLYALSNVGSLLALLSYPVLVEPFFRLGTQAVSWSWGYGLFALLCGTCAWQLYRQRPTGPAVAESTAAREASMLKPAASTPAPGFRDYGMWLLLSALPSVLLLATTNQLCQEVAVVPFLWILPLSLYLVSFIIAFDSPRWYFRPVWFGWMFLCVLAVIYCLVRGVDLGYRWQILAYSGAMLGCAMCCHGELAASRPAASYLTHFYLTISIGGALGGVFVVVVAPLIFTQYWEFHFGVMGCVFSAFWAYKRTQNLRISKEFWAMLGVGLIVVAISGGAGLRAWWSRSIGNDETMMRSRSFYGVMSVNRRSLPKLGEYRTLVNGQIRHGIQFLDPDKRAWCTSYYSHDSGVGVAILKHPSRKSPAASQQGLRLGVVGLGTGTLAAYGREGDVVRFYELNPDVRRIAYEYFTYCADTPAEVEVVLGDARIKMEQELAAGGSQKYDVLAIDAFSSDAIPMHLLTRECLQLYVKHLQPDGILAIHISNRFLNLQPVVRTLAEEAGFQPLLIEWENAEEHPAYSTSDWVLLTHNEPFLTDLEVQSRTRPWPPSSAAPLVWTDDYGGLLQVLK